MLLARMRLLPCSRFPLLFLLSRRSHVVLVTDVAYHHTQNYVFMAACVFYGCANQASGAEQTAEMPSANTQVQKLEGCMMEMAQPGNCAKMKWTRRNKRPEALSTSVTSVRGLDSSSPRHLPSLYFLTSHSFGPLTFVTPRRP